MNLDEWPEFLTVAEVAGILRVSKMTVYRLMHDRDLPAAKIGKSFRIPSAALRSYLGLDLDLDQPAV